MSDAMFGDTLKVAHSVSEHMSPGRSTSAFWSGLDAADAASSGCPQGPAQKVREDEQTHKLNGDCSRRFHGRLCRDQHREVVNSAVYYGYIRHGLGRRAGASAAMIVTVLYAG
ncbi:hypothetical protein [Streptomyces flaveus]|uniref:hypothetical protein n=1 Tax=Streptomyces flaveus TaxID=66370 RepID=UPI0033170D39